MQARREIDGVITKKAIDYRQRKVKEGKPFFNFVSFTQPHLPTLPHPTFEGKTRNGNYF